MTWTDKTLQTADPSRPHLERWIGAFVIVGFFVVLLGWAMFARLDAGATASGVVTVSGERKAVQHATAGVVDAILVQDGDHVQAGQVLVEVNDESDAESRSALADAISLRASMARAEALRDGRTTLRPTDTRGLPDWAQTLSRDAISSSAAALRDNRQSVAMRQQALIERAQSARQEAAANVAQSKSAEQQAALVAGRLKALQPVYDQGLVPEPQMLELKQRQMALEGEVSSRRLQAAASSSTAESSEREARSLSASSSAEASDQLRDSQSRLAALEPKLKAAQAKYERSRVKAPVTGTVVNLAIHTQGGVIAAGETLMEIVPDQQTLLINARLPPNTADQVKPGAVAQVRFAAFKDRSTPVFLGKVREISADRLEDKRTGASYFSMTVELPPETLKKINSQASQGFRLMPGLQADVVIPVEPRTALDYLVGPIRHAVWSSFREH